MELNLSAIIDISELRPSDKRRFVSLFCSTMVELPRSLWRPCFVCIDETHEFAPEGERSESTEAVALLGSKGRKRGYCLLTATQRLSKLSKDVAAECRNQFVGMMNLDVDLKRAADILGFGKDRWTEIRDLSPPGNEGEFFCFGPALSRRGVEKMRAGMVETTHPKAGQGRLSAPPAASEKIRGVLGELKDLAAKADEEARSLADAQKEIRELKRQLAAKSTSAVSSSTVVAAADDKSIKRAVDTALADYSRQVAEQDRGWQAAVKNLEKVVGDFRRRFAKIGQLCQVNGEAKVLLPSPIAQAKSIPSAPQIPRQPIGRDAPPRGVYEGQKLPKGEAAVLSALIQFPDGLRREQLTVLTGYKRSSRDAYIQRLREKGLVDDSRTLVAVNDSGRAALPNAEPLPTGPELQEYWLSRLPEGERAILQQLIDAYPNEVDRESLSESTGYKRSSRDAYLQRLRAKELIDEPSRGSVAASKELF
jgi:DNA-binding MarR family transcriptional regulator